MVWGVALLLYEKLWMLQPRKIPGQTWDTSWRCRSHRTAAGQGWPGSTCGRRRARDAPEGGCARLWQFVPLHPFPFSAIFWAHLCDKFFWLQMCLLLEFTPLCSASLAVVFPGLFHWKFLLHHLSLHKQTRHNCLERLFCELFFLYFPNVYCQQWDESDGKVLWVQVWPRSSKSSVSSSALCRPAKHVGIMKRSQIFSVLISISSLSTSTIP